MNPPTLHSIMSPTHDEIPSEKAFSERFAHAARPVASSGNGPGIRLSIVLIGTHSLPSVRRSIGELLGQTHAADTELLLASESDALLAEAAALPARLHRPPSAEFSTHSSGRSYPTWPATTTAVSSPGTVTPWRIHAAPSRQGCTMAI
jgi:hypothetical protein